MQVINDNMSFNDYWKEKSTKRKMSWAAKAKRFAQKHMQLESIRSEIVYGHMKRDEVRSLLDEHRTVQNPIARWDSNMHFSFSEQGLSEAMQAEGADVSSLTMTISRKNIVGQQPHEIAYGDMLDVAGNRRDLYEKFTDLETCTIHYREVTMVIYRYTYLQQPFAMYELVPCKQLSVSDLRLEETSFSTLNIATLLMEIATEWELRQEEFNYHAKKLKLRTMEAATLDSIEFELWDEKKLEKKISEYIAKDYNVDKIIEQVCRPWKKAIEKYFHAAVERSLKDEVETIGSNKNKPGTTVYEVKTKKYSAYAKPFPLISGGSSTPSSIWWNSRNDWMNRILSYMDIETNKKPFAIELCPLHSKQFTISNPTNYVNGIKSVNPKIDVVEAIKWAICNSESKIGLAIGKSIYQTLIYNGFKDITKGSCFPVIGIHREYHIIEKEGVQVLCTWAQGGNRVPSAHFDSFEKSLMNGLTQKPHDVQANRMKQ